MFQRVIYSLYSRSQSARPLLTESLRQTISDAVTIVNFVARLLPIQRPVNYLMQFGKIQSILIQ